jgi:LacI family transcriptional regulator
MCDNIDFDVALRNTVALLQRQDRPDAIVAFNDILLFAAFNAIKQQGLRIPEDVALIGFTDDAHARYTTPCLSAIEDQSAKIGQTACQLLLANIAGDTKIRKVIVPQKLVIRETSAKKKK